MVRQLNVFVENKPGRLKSVTEILLKKKVNILAFTIQDRDDFGVMKLLIDKPEQAYLALADKGFACVLKEIIVVSIKDKPGNLHKLATALLKHDVNVTDTHGFVIEPDDLGVCALEVQNVGATEKMLRRQGFSTLTEEELYEL